MATSRRRKAPTRWLMAGLSGLAAAGFLGAILGGPHPTDATPAPTSSQAPGVTAGDSRAGATSAPVFSQAQQAPGRPAQPPIAMAPPRFRTRGS
jgi:hypothetical protein